MKNAIIDRYEDGMNVNLVTFLSKLQKEMRMLEEILESAVREVIPEFSESYGWFLHTTNVGTWPLTKYCALQEIYQLAEEKMLQSLEIPLCDMIRLFTKEQLEVVLPIVFND